MGELHGNGIMKYSNGRRYEGSWAHNVYEGVGSLHEGNGDIYQGEFHNHRRHGEGTQVISRLRYKVYTIQVMLGLRYTGNVRIKVCM